MEAIHAQSSASYSKLSTMTEESNVGSSVEDPKEQTVSTDIPKTDETIEMTDENEDEGGHDENTAESAEGGTSTHGLNPILTSSGKKRPPFKYNPGKVTLRFIFANRDGLTVTLECNHADTVGEVKGALLSVWPEGTSLRFSMVMFWHIELTEIYCF